jgi:hypothetical protein
MSLTNPHRQYALVTNAFQVQSYQDFMAFPASNLGLVEELIAAPNGAEDEDGAELALWRLDPSPALPRLDLGDNLFCLLPPYLKTGHALILALVAPGQRLDDAAAVLLGFDGAIWLGTASSLRLSPGPYHVEDFHRPSLTYGPFKP